MEINPDILSVDDYICTFYDYTYVYLTLVNICGNQWLFLQDKPSTVKTKHHSDFTFWKTLMKNLKKQQKQGEINALRPLEMEQKYVT